MTKSVDNIQREIAEEKAGALGRTGQRLQAAVEQYHEHQRSSAHGDRHADARREQLLWELAERVESLIVQREACGLRDAHHVLAFYGVPHEAKARVGAKRPRH
jgi:hypothetical protein